MGKIEIWIDNREQSLRELFHNDNIDIVEKNLDHGDIIFMYDDTIFAIFERKTLDDLASSIKDKRYSNQKYAMLQAYDRSILYYIIEGHFEYNKDTMLTGAIVNTILRDDIRIFKTCSVKDTYYMIRYIYDQLLKDPLKYCEKDHYNKVIVKKEKQKTLSDFFTSVLIQVPGVSYKIAEEYVSHFGTFKDFIETMMLKPNPLNDEKLKLLQSIKVNNRSVSKNTLNNILHYMFNGNTLQSKE